MSEPDSLDEARKAKLLGDLLDTGAEAGGDPDVDAALQTALSIRSRAGGALGDAARERLAAELFPAPRRRSVFFYAAAAIGAAAAALLVTNSLFTRKTLEMPTPLPRNERTVLAQTARESVMALLGDNESSRAARTLDGILEDQRNALAAKEVAP